MSTKQPIFIFGVARSGTTLLQRLLNSYEDVLIWGEHVGFLRPLAAAYYTGEGDKLFDRAEPLADVLRDTDPVNRFQGYMGWLSWEDRGRLFRGFLDSVFLPQGLPGKNFWGFKEIQYLFVPSERTLPFLKEMYPDAIFVFLVRNPYNMLASRKIGICWNWLGDCQRLCYQWKVWTRLARNWHESERAASFWIRYEDMIEGRGEILDLVARMGKSWGEKQWAVLNSSGEARGSAFDNGSYHERWKTLPWQWLAVASRSLDAEAARLGYPSPPLSQREELAGTFLFLKLVATEIWRTESGKQIWRALRKRLFRNGRAAKRAVA